jgi:dienelactone hydrolase
MGSAMRRIRLLAFSLAASALLVACGGGGAGHGEAGPTDPGSGNGNPGGGPKPAFRALFEIGTGILPYPTDIYFLGTNDGTLNLPASLKPLLPHFDSLNALDGYSTTMDITVRFSQALDAASLAANLRVVRVSIDNATKAPTGVVGVLVPGTDFSATVSTDIDTGGAVLVIRPLKPFAASSGGTNAGYLVLLTSGILNSTGVAAQPDTDYKTIRDAAIADINAGLATPTCASLTNATLNGLCKLTFAHLRIGAAIGITPTTVVQSFTFSTQATQDTLRYLAATLTAQSYTIANTGLTTATLGLPVAGRVNIYQGSLTVPYYLTAASSNHDFGVMTHPWTAAGASPVPGIDPASRNLTRFNPVPAKTADVTIPLLIMVPNGVGTPPKPPGGWPVVVFQHGFPRDRTDALLVADSFAQAGFATVAIDLPLHGITPASAPYAQPLKTSIERTFDLDINTADANGLAVSATPDGVVDPTGSNWLNLSNVLVQRDNLRQAESDLIALVRTIPTIDLDAPANGADFDANRIHMVGYSIGGIMIGTVLGVLGSEAKASALPYAGGTLGRLFVESARYGAAANALLAARGVSPNTTLYTQFWRDAQTAVDSADPINYTSTMAAGAAGGGRTILLPYLVGGEGTPPAAPDNTVPNVASLRLINGLGLQLVNAVPGTTVVAGTPGAYVPISQGGHNSLLDPTPSLAATVELQGMITKFLFANGAAVVLTDPNVIAP